MGELLDLQQSSVLARKLRESIMQDRQRPGYHFCDLDGCGEPGDPNGAFYANGRYHLMYLYWNEEKGHCWGHVSSIDMLHWHHHPDCLCAGEHGRGCFSGGAFLDEDGKCYLAFWDYIAGEDDFGGIRIAVSKGEPYEKWEIFPEFAVTANVADGVGKVIGRDGCEHIVGAADPGNLWKENGKYYMQTGNLMVLEKYSRAENPPQDLCGDWSDLFSSEDMEHWNYEGRFYDRTLCLDTDISEDCMCPSFLPLAAQQNGGEMSGKYLQLFIAHNRGCQYYTGIYDRSHFRFIPEKHGRMSVVDSAYFAPEALMAPDGRQIMWVWLRDNHSDWKKRGWSGVFGMARELWYEKSDDTLRMAPAKEYESLRINPQKFTIDLEREACCRIPLVNGESFELQLNDILPENRDSFELRVRVSEKREEFTCIYFDTETEELVVDSTKGSDGGWPAVERMPLQLENDEPLTLRVFVDKSVIEVYGNTRAAIGRRIYPAFWGTGVELHRKNNGCRLNVMAYEMAPCNPY